MRHLLTLADVTSDEISRIFAITVDLKTKFLAGVREPLLPGRVMALLFEKPSLRTRVSFQSGIAHLGGSSMMLGDDVGFGKRERADDFARVLSELVDIIVWRSKQHETVQKFAEHATCPVINGLTDQAHPCQALADLYTLREHAGTLKGVKLAWVGDANNVSRSLAWGCAQMGVHFAIATPVGYEFETTFLNRLQQAYPNMQLTVTHDPHEAVQDAQCIYTDVWASMGQEQEQEKRRHDFASYQVNEKLMQAATSDTVFMHCLPAKRGEEVTDGVMDSPASIIVQQAGNRMHVQKGIIMWLLGQKVES
ncbi:MAG: ornithine carbamoyltransferase [Pirellulales bacterium]